MTKRQINTQIEPGDFVEVVSSPDKHWVGMVGMFDQEWAIDGVVKYVVLDPNHEDEFTYATEIKLYKKA